MRRVTILLLTAVLGMATAGTADEPAAKSDPDKAAVVQADTQFALDLYGQLRGKEGNVFFSPFSVSTALAMTSVGARGRTAEETASTLHLTLEPKRLGPAFRELLADLNGDGRKRGYHLSIANALWGQKNFGFLPAFLETTRTDFGGGLREVDFIGATEAARRTINEWVEQQTNDKIKDLLQPGVLTADTRLVLTNAIYFKGDWASKFRKEQTREEPFQLSAAEKVKVPLMSQTGDYRYHDTGTVQVLELPYAGKELSMIALLPKKMDGLPDLEKALTPANLKEWLGKLGKQEVHVALPRFKFSREVTLNGPLTALGMASAFDPSKADFTGINGTGPRLFISAVVHKAFVDVNEEGTEAAAATGVVVTLTAERISPVFRADHPFVFLIRDNRSGSILFLGRVADPRG